MPRVQKFQITDELIPNLEHYLNSYMLFCDHNPLHYFTLPEAYAHPDSWLTRLLADANVRFVPGAIPAVALHEQAIAAYKQGNTQGAEVPAHSYTFPFPTLFTPDYRVLAVSQTSPIAQGVVQVEEIERTIHSDDADAACDMDEVCQDVFSVMGQLWREHGVSDLAQGNAGILQEITIGGAVTGKNRSRYEKKGRIIADYKQGSVVVRPVDAAFFTQFLQPYLVLGKNS